MLITPLENELYQNLNSRWGELDRWLDQHQAVMSDVLKSIKVFRDHWRATDRSILTDPDELQSACQSLDIAERYAMERGYPAPKEGQSWWKRALGIERAGKGAAHGECPSTDEMSEARHPIIYAAGEQAEQSCKDHPGSALCKASVSTGDPSWCQRLNFPAVTCDKNGMKDWAVYATAIGGVAMLGMLVYAAYKAAPVALALYPPTSVLGQAMLAQQARTMNEQSGR